MAEAAASLGRPWGLLDQLFVQLCAVIAAILFSAVGTFLLVVLVEKTVGFRLPKAEEQQGLDHTLHGEHGYGMLSLDYSRQRFCRQSFAILFINRGSQR